MTCTWKFPTKTVGIYLMVMQTFLLVHNPIELDQKESRMIVGCLMNNDQCEVFTVEMKTVQRGND